MAVQELQFSQRVSIQSILGRPDKGAGLAGQNVRIGGWVRTGREAEKGAFAFLEVNDGSFPANLQVIIRADVYELSDVVSTGTSVHVEGFLRSPPEGVKQSIELHVDRVIYVGTVDAAKYPLPKPKGKNTLMFEFLRDFVHLRPRTDKISAVARIRSALAVATHDFFQQNGFLYVHTPIITTSDCEGAGEMFQVTSLIKEAEKLENDLIENPPPSEADIVSAELVFTQKGDALRLLKSSTGASKEEIVAAVAELKEAKENLSRLEERWQIGERVRLDGAIPRRDGNVDYAGDFFARQAFLTVSGQLQVETYACALSSVYTFGPTFRAEKSHTSKHLAEFWMVEPELAFADIEDAMNCAQAYVKFLCQRLLDRCKDDVEFLSGFMEDKAKKQEKPKIPALQRLLTVVESPFHRITYTEAIAILEQAPEAREFVHKVEWGIDLASEHETCLTEMFKKPVIVYNYPKSIKPFYMKVNEDNITVAAMDVLVPDVGELIGGSQREENYEVLRERMLEMDLSLDHYQWYLDLRRYGTVKHSGFGLGFERMILFATGIENIRDVIPFPRTHGKADL